MRQRAKLFKNGRSQAVRLPAAFRFDCSEVYIHKDPKNGDIILSRKPASWDEFFQLIDHMEIPGDFMENRENESTRKRDQF